MRRTLLIIAAISLLSTSAMAAVTKNGRTTNGRAVNGGKINGGKINGIDVGRTGIHTNTAQAVAGRLILR